MSSSKNDIPSWVTEAIFGLLGALAKLISAETDDEREEALMSAAEATKAALDRKRFG